VLNKEQALDTFPLPAKPSARPCTASPPINLYNLSAAAGASMTSAGAKHTIPSIFEPILFVSSLDRTPTVSTSIYRSLLLCFAKNNSTVTKIPAKPKTKQICTPPSVHLISLTLVIINILIYQNRS
jgi:hypothetical protein